MLVVQSFCIFNIGPSQRNTFRFLDNSRAHLATILGMGYLSDDTLDDSVFDVLWMFSIVS